MTIAAVDDGKIWEPFKVDVPSTAKVCEVQDFIYNGLQRNALVGQNFETALDILPLPEMPSITDSQMKKYPNFLVCRILLGTRFISLYGYQIQTVSFINVIYPIPDPAAKGQFPVSLTSSIQWLMKISLLSILNFEAVSGALQGRSSDPGVMAFKDIMQ